MDKRWVNHRDELMAVRRRLLAGEAEPTGAADGVGVSWQRAHARGMSPRHRCDDAVLDRPSLKRLRADNERLIAIARPELENLRQQIGDSGSAVLLSDAQGVILERQGDPRFRARSQRVALSPGACWEESSRGTNAIGLALAEGSCASVHGPEHFLDCNTFLTCAATPIRDVAGNIIGALDVSGDQSARQIHALGLVRMGARLIENRILSTEFPQAIHLHFHARPEFLGTLGEGIVAVDSNGTVLAINEVARSCFGALSGDSDFEDLFEGTLEGLLRNTAPLPKLRIAGGVMVCLRVASPMRKTTTRAAADTTPETPVFDDLHAGDPAVAETLRRAHRVFVRDIPLLIQGETGTGKEWVARALHRQGPRSDGSLVAVNCAAIPDGLAEAELFGYVPGAFTGASPHGAQGRIAEASGGVLFLDEIGDMPMSLQTRLLRVIQERAVTPLGGGQPKSVDFSLISATNCDLAARVSEGRFRADLYYRLCGLRVQLPPLRERSDLVALIERFIADTDRSAVLSDAVWNRLLGYAWPGNLRQLHSVLSTALALRDSGQIVRQCDLPEELLTAIADTGVDAAAASVSLRTRERQHMKSVLAAHGGNYSATARALGISRSTLYRRLPG